MSRERDPLENAEECPNCGEPVNGRTCSNCGINPDATKIVTCGDCGDEVPKDQTKYAPFLSARLCQGCYPSDEEVLPREHVETAKRRFEVNDA